MPKLRSKTRPPAYYFTPSNPPTHIVKAEGLVPVMVYSKRELTETLELYSSLGKTAALFKYELCVVSPDDAEEEPPKEPPLPDVDYWTPLGGSA